MRLLMMGTGPFAVPTFASLLDSPHQVVALVSRPVPPPKGRVKSPCAPMRDLAVQRGVPDSGTGGHQRRGIAPGIGGARFSIARRLRLRPDLVGRHAGHLALGRHQPARFAAAQVSRRSSDQLGPVPRRRRNRRDRAAHDGPLGQRALPGAMPDADRPRRRRRPTRAAAVRNRRRCGPRSARHDRPVGRTFTAGRAAGPAAATKAPRLKKTDGEVDWNRSARQIASQVRALKPWPGTFTTWQRPHGEAIRLILDHVSVAADAACSGQPGEVVLADKSRLHVATADGRLSLDRVQPAGKRSMAIDEFLRGHAVAVGDRFAT